MLSVSLNKTFHSFIPSFTAAVCAVIAGGASDRGYSSMTQDDMRQISQLINGGEASSGKTRDVKQQPHMRIRRRSTHTEKRDSGS